MRFAVSAWAIRNPIPIAALFVAMVCAGALSYVGLPIKYYPNISVPAVVITATRSGAAPADVESQVTRPIENAVAGMPDVTFLASTVTEGSSSTLVEFAAGLDPRKTEQDVRSRIEQIRDDLPRDIPSPTVGRLEIDDHATVTYAVSEARGSSSDISWFVDSVVTRRLQGQAGIGRVHRLGGADREINVLIHPAALLAHGLTAAEVSEALARQNLNAPGGRAAIGAREQTIRIVASEPDADVIRGLLIPTPSGGIVPLSEVADVGDGSAELRSLALLNGEPVVGFEVYKTKEAGEVEVEQNVEAAIAAMTAEFPDIQFRKIVSTVDQTRQSYWATMSALLEGIVLAALIVLVFLRDWRATAVTIVAMPVSLIPTFALMRVAGFSLNTVTLLGLTLVIGVVVDDAIVEIENIEKRIAAGLRPYDAAGQAADQIGLAVVATTLAIAAVFLPTAFMPGVPGQFFREFGITVSAAVLLSLAAARLLTPLMAAYVLLPKAEPARERLWRPYMRSLNWALSHKAASLLLFVAISAAAVLAAATLKTSVKPESDTDYLYIDVEGPPGATLADMRSSVGQLGELLQVQPETRSVFAQIGGGGIVSGPGTFSSADGLNHGFLTVALKPERAVTNAELRDRWRPMLREIPDVRACFDMSDIGAAEVQIILTSESGDGLVQATEELQRQIHGLSALADPRSTPAPVAGELTVRPNADQAARLGVSSAAVAAAVRTATMGDPDAQVARVDIGGRRIPIRVRLPLADRSDLSAIRRLPVRGAGGRLTTLGAVADVSIQAGPAQIDRIDRKREITTTADTRSGVETGEAEAQIEGLPIMARLPAGVERSAQGQEQVYRQLFAGFAAAILAALGLVYAVMAILFRSVFKPVIILSALPTAIAGALFILLVTHRTLSLPSLIGCLLLMGLAAKNSILLVEFAAARERDGVPRRTALLQACRERARPIAMTTLAMMAGMLPTALALGKGFEFRQPMGLAVIGGLISSTALSLLLVPVVYELIAALEDRMTQRLGRALAIARAEPS